MNDFLSRLIKEKIISLKQSGHGPNCRCNVYDNIGYGDLCNCGTDKNNEVLMNVLDELQIEYTISEFE